MSYKLAKMRTSMDVGDETSSSLINYNWNNPAFSQIKSRIIIAASLNVSLEWSFDLYTHP